eukprot:SAG22_NODE_2881_length_2130_cov_1.194485_1_plen_602_part_10
MRGRPCRSSWPRSPGSRSPGRRPPRTSRVAPTSGPEDVQPDLFARRCLLAHPGQLEAHACAGPLPAAEDVVSMSVLWADAKKLVRLVPYLRIIPAQNLRNAPRPSLALDTHGHVTVSVAHAGHSGGGEVNLFQPLTGQTAELAEQALQDAHQALADRGAELPETAEELQFDEADCDEAIVFCLDISNSMDNHCGFTDKPPDVEDESDDEELDELLSDKLHEDLVGPAVRKVEKAVDRSQPEKSDEDVTASHGEAVFAALVELRCHESISDMSAVVACFRTKRDRASAATDVLQEWCREAPGGREGQLARAELVAAHIELFVRVLVGQAAAASAEAAAQGETSVDFICPITQELMVDPVIATDGHSYERSAIERWLASHNTSPLTGAELTSTTLTPNRNLKSQIASRQEAEQQQDDQADQDTDDGEQDDDDDAFDSEEEEEEESGADSRLTVIFRGQPVRVRCSDLVSVRALCRLVEQELTSARLTAFDEAGILELKRDTGSSGGRSGSGGGGSSLAKNRTLRSYGIVPGEHSLRAVQGRRPSTFDVCVTKSRSPYISMPLVCTSNDTCRGLLWRVCRATITDTRRLHQLQDLVPSKNNLWCV